jgi:DNA-binding NtrC family response regulator
MEHSPRLTLFSPTFICRGGWDGNPRESRAEPRHAPFILFTAFADEDTHQRALEIGALTLLDKPFDIDYLREIVAQVLY